jgi:plastocyanin
MMSSGSLRREAAAAVLVLTLAVGCSGPGPGRVVTFQSRDYTYTGLHVDAKAGDKVTFVMTNYGEADHEFEIFDPAGTALGEIEPVSSGQTGKRTLTLTKPGTYHFVCGVSDHEARGMQGTFVVR